MKKIKIKFILLFMLLLGIKTQAQEAIIVAGGNIENSSGSISYTVGQLYFETQEGSSGSISSSVQQPFEITVVLGLEEVKGIKLQCTVFPNPTTKNVTLLIENYEIENLSYSIFDINGRSIANNKISSNETFISMENLPSTTYLIKILKLNKELKTFKIIKRN